MAVEGPTPASAPAQAGASAPEPWPRWWIYGAAIGAVVVGAAAVYLTTTGEDTQTFEVHHP